MTSSSYTHRDLLIHLAREEGFFAAGVATLNATPHGDAYESWLAKGRHAGMTYMSHAKSARLNPASRFDWAASILVVALGYDQHLPAGLPDNHPLRGLAKYAWGRDYHRIMEKKLKHLARRITEHDALPIHRARYYSDTGPVLERPWAQAAGIGWQGKNSMLINREHGSFFFLGLIFLDAKIAPSEPETDHCGNCRRCIDACPTHAITDDRQVDAGRCISYWTVEATATPPDELESRFGEWWFGCDVCQNACPYNRRGAAPVSVPDLALRERYLTLTYDMLATMDADTFDTVFQASPVRRAGLEPIRRNAAAAEHRISARGRRNTSDPAPE